MPPVLPVGLCANEEGIAISTSAPTSPTITAYRVAAVFMAETFGLACLPGSSVAELPAAEPHLHCCVPDWLPAVGPVPLAQRVPAVGARGVLFRLRTGGPPRTTADEIAGYLAR
jgi:hypothetical protein